MSTVARDIGTKISISGIWSSEHSEISTDKYLALTIKYQEHSRPVQSVGFAIDGEDRQLGWKLKEARILEAELVQPLLVFSALFESQAKSKYRSAILPSSRLKFNLQRSYRVGSTSWLKKEEEIVIHASQILDATPNGKGQSRGIYSFDRVTGADTFP